MSHDNSCHFCQIFLALGKTRNKLAAVTYKHDNDNRKIGLPKSYNNNKSLTVMPNPAAIDDTTFVELLLQKVQCNVVKSLLQLSSQHPSFENKFPPLSANLRNLQYIII